MTTDIAQYAKSCQSCQSRNKTADKPCPTQTRPTISEPYEEVAMDIIGPVPRGKGGYKYALTLICMASRWPEIYPLKQPDTDHVAQALIEFMVSPWHPQGFSQFMAEALKKACKMLCITHIYYRPQGNGVLERFHGTLKPILSKACDSRLDWVSFLPVTLSAIRNIPCRSTGISPAELVFGRSPRSFIDILFEGWTNPTFSKVNFSEWVQRLQSTLPKSHGQGA